jgi:hypothetical protein
MGDGTLLKLLAVTVACGVILVGSSGFAAAQTLREDLQKLEGLRDGLNTPLDLVDKTGAEILNKYSAPTDRGQIYYQLAFIYGQSGLRRPEKLIEYAKKAMDLPLEEDQRLDLFIYWGDAQRFADPKSPPAERRKKAATVYLDGLRETQELSIPAKAPNVPAGMKGDVSGDPKMVAAWQKRQQEASDAQRKAKAQIELVQDRDILMNQVVDLYTSPPFATDEMIEIASKKQLNPAAIDALVERVNTAIAAMPKPAPIEPAPIKPPTQPLAHKGLFIVWGSFAALLLVFALVILALRIRSRARERGAR